MDGRRAQITKFFNALLNQDKTLDIPTVDGEILTITKKDTARKARDNYKNVSGNPVEMSEDEFLVKLNVEAHIDEIAETSRGNKKPLVPDQKNHDFAKDGFAYRRAYFEDFDGQYYEITLSVGHNGTVATVYNVGKIEKSVLPSAKIIAGAGSKALGKTLSKHSISNNSENVNKKSYSFGEEELDFGSYVSEGSEASENLKESGRAVGGLFEATRDAKLEEAEINRVLNKHLKNFKVTAELESHRARVAQIVELTERQDYVDGGAVVGEQKFTKGNTESSMEFCLTSILQTIKKGSLPKPC